MPLANWHGEHAVQPAQEHRAEIRGLSTALDQLSDEQRAVVLLVGLEEMTYAETASALNIPLGTVMSRLSRGRERLRLLMMGSDPASRTTKDRR